MEEVKVNPFQPFNSEEFQILKIKIGEIGGYIPENLMPFVWDVYLAISGTNFNRPCGCQSAAGQWIKAINVINDYIKEVDKKLQNGM